MTCSFRISCDVLFYNRWGRWRGGRTSWLPYSTDSSDLDLSNVFYYKYQWEIWKNTAGKSAEHYFFSHPVLIFCICHRLIHCSCSFFFISEKEWKNFLKLSKLSQESILPDDIREFVSTMLVKLNFTFWWFAKFDPIWP